jgi:hypothetical protein
MIPAPFAQLNGGLLDERETMLNLIVVAVVAVFVLIMAVIAYLMWRPGTPVADVRHHTRPVAPPAPPAWPSWQARAAVPAGRPDDRPTRVNQLTQPLSELGPVQPAIIGGELLPAAGPRHAVRAIDVDITGGAA